MGGEIFKTLCLFVCEELPGCIRNHHVLFLVHTSTYQYVLEMNSCTRIYQYIPVRTGTYDFARSCPGVQDSRWSQDSEGTSPSLVQVSTVTVRINRPYLGSRARLHDAESDIDWLDSHECINPLRPGPARPRHSSWPGESPQAQHRDSDRWIRHAWLGG